MTQTERDGLKIRQLGAIAILNCRDTEQAVLAQHLGVELQPGDDLLDGLARSKGVSRHHLMVYMEALAQGIDAPAANLIAEPAAGAVQ